MSFYKAIKKFEDRWGGEQEVWIGNWLKNTNKWLISIKKVLNPLVIKEM